MKKMKKMKQDHHDTETFKIYPSLPAEREAARADANAFKEYLLVLAARERDRECPDSELLAQLTKAWALEKAADNVKPDLPRSGRGNPDWKKDAIYDRPKMAVQVELHMRMSGKSQDAASTDIANELGLDASSVRKCHSQFRGPAKEYVDLIGCHRSGANQGNSA